MNEIEVANVVNLVWKSRRHEEKGGLLTHVPAIGMKQLACLRNTEEFINLYRSYSVDKHHLWNHGWEHVFKLIPFTALKI